MMNERLERVVVVSEDSQRELLDELHVLRKQRDELQSRMSAMCLEQQSGYANAVEKAAMVVDALAGTDEIPHVAPRDNQDELITGYDGPDGFCRYAVAVEDLPELAERIRALKL
jgi:hypothetical protein